MGYKESAGAQGAFQGGAAGAGFGPPGIAIGAGIGGLLGYMGASDQESKDKKAHKEQEEFRRHQNKYAAFFGNQPTMERARAERSAVPGVVSGLTQGAQMAGMIGNMYRDPPRYDTRTGKEILRFDPQTGEQITQNYYG